MKTTLHKLLLAILPICLTLSHTHAQDQAGNFLRAGGGEESNKLIGAYLSSSLKGLGQGVNDGWQNTAKPLGLLGLDLRLNFGFAVVPNKDQSFDFNNIGLNTDHSKTYLVLQEGVDPNRPTVYGKYETSPPKVFVRANVGGIDTSIANFVLPTGADFNYSPSLPTLQLSVGIVKNTEITLRYYPRTTFPRDYVAGLFGIGVKHDIVQWIPAYKDLTLEDQRPFDLSVFFGFTTFDAQYNRAILAVDTFAYNPDPSIPYDNQKMTFTGTTWTFGIIGSKEFRPTEHISFSPYVGINYAYSGVRFRYIGDYPVPVANDQYSSAHPQVTKIQKVTDPVNILGEVSTLRANLGARAKIAAFTISGEYSFGKINTMTVGVGINIQSIKPYKMM